MAKDPTPGPAGDAEALSQALLKVRKACHEINQPIQIIMGTAEMLLDDLGEESLLAQDVVKITEQAERLAVINARLRRIAMMQE